MAIILFMGAISALGVGGYIVLAGPIAGAVIAVGIAFVLRGAGGDTDVTP